MMNIRVIKTEEDYEQAMERADQLMDAEPGSREEQELEVLAVLIEKYEKEHYPIPLPDPIEAIKFYMEQNGLKQKDMVPYFKSQSKVSEVLNRKRPLSLGMMRALHDGLGIPAEVLLHEPDAELPEGEVDWQVYPFTEMFKRGYFDPFRGKLAEAKHYGEELIRELLDNFQGLSPQQVYCRYSDKEIDGRALEAWHAQALKLAALEDLPVYDAADLSDDFFKKLQGLNYLEQGPQLAAEYLNKKGIHFFILEHLPKTYLDGACFLTPDGSPVVALTLRHDRLDNFWFTLAHELAHLKLHLQEGDRAFFDDTSPDGGRIENDHEQEADAFARGVLIPAEEWEQISMAMLGTRDAGEVLEEADRLSISPAILAGRIRWESGDYRLFSDLLGHRVVREMLAEL